VPTPLFDYYRELQIREKLTPTGLIADWDGTTVNEISADFRTAMMKSQITQQAVPIRPGSSNQSIGNQVADFFTLQFPASLTDLLFELVPVLAIQTRSWFVDEIRRRIH